MMRRDGTGKQNFEDTTQIYNQNNHKIKAYLGIGLRCLRVSLALVTTQKIITQEIKYPKLIRNSFSTTSLFKVIALMLGIGIIP